MLLSFVVLPGAWGATAVFLAGGASAVALTRLAPPHYGRVPRIRSVVPDASVGAPRMRTGRLPLPRRVSELTPTEEPALALVHVFVDRLAGLPAHEWLEAGRNLMADASSMDRATAFAILEATIGAHGAAIAAWYTRDAVETAAFFASNGLARCTSADRRVFAAAHAAAEEAALALLMHEHLSPADFGTLLAPFGHVLSTHDVARLATSRDCAG